MNLEVRCERCGELHDIEDLEPSRKRPDAYCAVPEEERARRTKASDDFCVVEDGAGASRWFVRTLLPIPVFGLDDPCSWGIWCEVSARDYAKIQLLWRDPKQRHHAPFVAALANDLDGYPPCAGLRGKLRLSDPQRLPSFEFDTDVDHPIAREARIGVTPTRVLEWLAPYLHESRSADAWPFDQAPDVAAITDRGVLEENLPILVVIHYSEDHSWAFLSGTSASTDDGRVVAMQTALDRDPSLRKVADLGPGWVAERDHVGGSWRREFDSEM